MAVARPLVIGGALAKVVLVVVLSHSIGLLQPQIERTKPVEVEEFHKHL